jgi:hypothetical protein
MNQPIEDHEEWVIQDRVPARPGIDERAWTFGDEQPSRWSDAAYLNFETQPMHGHESCSQVLHLRCRRKDLPATPEPPQNKYVGHICKLRNGDVTDGPVEKRKGGGYCLSAKHKGVLRSWLDCGLHDESKPQSPFDIVGIIEDQPPQTDQANNDALLAELEHKLSVHPMCQAMANTQLKYVFVKHDGKHVTINLPAAESNAREYVVVNDSTGPVTIDPYHHGQTNGPITTKSGSLKMAPAGGPGYAGVADLVDDLLTVTCPVTCPVTGEIVKLSADDRKFFSPWMNPDGTFECKVPLVPKNGYRFLPRGEPVIEGDMCWSIGIEKWIKSGNWNNREAGRQGPPTKCLGPYIRKIGAAVIDNGDNPNCGKPVKQALPSAEPQLGNGYHVWDRQATGVDNPPVKMEATYVSKEVWEANGLPGAPVPVHCGGPYVTREVFEAAQKQIADLEFAKLAADYDHDRLVRAAKTVMRRHDLGTLASGAGDSESIEELRAALSTPKKGQ